MTKQQIKAIDDFIKELNAYQTDAQVTNFTKKLIKMRHQKEYSKYLISKYLKITIKD